MIVLQKRYLNHKPDGTQETIDEFVERISMGNEQYRKELIEPLVFLPNSPTLFNLGTDNGGTLSACFKFDVADTMTDEALFSGILDTAHKAAMVTKHGGGVGYALGKVRPRGSLVHSTHGAAMGPVAVIRWLNEMGKMLTQSGKREAAQMGILPVWHEDIRDFIHMKDENPDALSTFNISVALDDEFMRRVVRGTDGVLTPERELLWEIAESAWKTGDPGVYFVDRAERDNPTPWLGELTGTNPCVTSETMILTVYEGAKSFKELADRGEDVLVHAWHPDTKLPVVRWMRNPRKTRERADILEVEFDSGLKVRCTPDHNFRSFRGDKVAAQDLRIGQSVRAFSMSQHRDGHLRVHGWQDNGTAHQWVHRMVWEEANGPIPEGLIVHHLNHDETDNRIENLALIDLIEHNRHHYPNRLRNGFFHKEEYIEAMVRNHKVVGVRHAGFEDVYNGTVDDAHTYIIVDPEPVAGLVSGIVSANCGEVPLLNNEACTLGSINLAKFVEDGRFNYAYFERIVRLAVRYLDDVIDKNIFPHPDITEAVRYTRKIGLGVCGLADALALMRVDYDSPFAETFARFTARSMRDIADAESKALAYARGPAPCFTVTRRMMRNSTTLCIAPTGTIAILMGASSGIEPHFALENTRRMEYGTMMTEKVEFDGFVPKTAMEIAPTYHVRMQAAWQQYVDLAVSKTINLGNSATVEDVFNAYVEMWQSGCKGGTVYRDGSRAVQVLTVSEADSASDQCPQCGAGIKHIEGCEYCAADCGWGACSV